MRDPRADRRSIASIKSNISLFFFFCFFHPSFEILSNKEGRRGKTKMGEGCKGVAGRRIFFRGGSFTRRFVLAARSTLIDITARGN